MIQSPVWVSWAIQQIPSTENAWETNLADHRDTECQVTWNPCITLLRDLREQLFPLIHSYCGWGLRLKVITLFPLFKPTCPLSEQIARMEENKPHFSESTTDSLLLSSLFISLKEKRKDCSKWPSFPLREKMERNMRIPVFAFTL